MAVIAKQRYKLDIAPKGGWRIVYASQHDDGAREIEFEITNQGKAFSIPASINVSVQGIKSNKSYFSHSCSYSGNIVTMALADDMTDVIGKAICVLKFTNSSQQKLATAKFVLNVDSDSSSEGVIIDTEAEEIFNQMLNDIRAQASAISVDIAELQSMVGSPLVASTASAMTDHNKIYVYVGSESGYTNGNWYYWNGSAWTSGGVYNSIAFETDKTLSVENMAADAKKTGDEITNLKEDLYENERFNKSEWENGAISASTGANVTNSSRIRTKSFLPWGVTKLYSTNSNVRFLVYAYDSNGTYVGGWWNDGTFNPSDVKALSSVDFNAIYANPDYADYHYRACIYITNGTARVETISDVYIKSISIVDYIKGNVNLTLDRLEKIEDNTDLDNLTTAGNYYIANSSSLATMTNRPLFASTGGRIFVLYIISHIRPLQIYLGYNSTGSPVIYVRYMGASGWYPWQRMYGRTARNIRVLGFNLGKFNYGKDGGLAEHVEEKITNFKRFIGNINPDITLTCECATYIDSSETYQTIPTIFAPLYNKYASFNECAVFANAFDYAKLEIDGGIYLRDDLNAYAGQVARQVIEIDGKQLLMSGGFLRVLGTETERYQAFVNYLASITNYEYSIIYLDTNVLSEAERVNIANAASEAGYTICNGGYFGLIPTLHTEAMFRPIDNIFVKGNIKVKNFEVLASEYDNLASDHLPIVADLTLY